MSDSFASRLDQISQTLSAAADRVGRSASEVTLVAVSKSHPPEALTEALEAGQTLFGENRVQEARAKAALLPSRARWHLIGHLQSNKVRQTLPLFECIQSIDSLALATEVNRVAAELGLFPRVLLEVNVAGEGTKFGFSPERLHGDMEELLALDRLAIEGVMAIPPYSPEPEDSRRYFAALRECRDKVSEAFRVPLPELSMGMSHDFAVAVEEGATYVRVGTALFGERKGKTWKPEGPTP